MEYGLKKYFDHLTAVTTANMGFDGALVTQGSPEWLKMRLGVITASKAKMLIAKDRSDKGPGESRQTYLRELIAEVATGRTKDFGEYKQTEWGKANEESARQIFAFNVGIPVTPIPFIYGDDTCRFGCSPDGLADAKSGIELKCPWTTEVYIDFLLNNEIKPEYIDQVQFSMFVTGMPFWTFANYDPRMRVASFHAVTIERDEVKMATYRDAVGQMVHDMDRALDRLGIKFGEQWAHTPSTPEEIAALDALISKVEGE